MCVPVHALVDSVIDQEQCAKTLVSLVVMALPSTSMARRTTISALYLTRTSTSMHISLESEMRT
ncbi:hypothetical protein NC651_022548 [Populus alba x Populus x berolinensis]|nr:hypothetical protein NC651_022548 [Populus alba x Populus x berolinensis]